MAYQETTTTSYGSRVGSSFKGILSGLFLLVFGTGLLWWNEGSNKKTGDAIDDAYDVTQIVPDISTLNPALSGKMVLATGTASTTETLSDGLFGLNLNAVRLERKVEYYQWVEHASSHSEDKLGGSQETTTTYTYDKQWVDKPINSSNFKDPAFKGNNTVWKQVEEQKWIAKNVTFGAYVLPENLIAQISGEQQAAVDPSTPAFTNFKNSVNKAVTASGNMVYIGPNPASPEVGDVKITFTMISPSNLVTIWSQVNGNTFCSYTHKNGQKISDLYMGSRSLEEVKQNAEETNTVWTWVLRVVGFFLIYWAFSNLFGFIVAILKVVPALAAIASFGTSLISGILAFVWSLVVIILAWIFYRPIVLVLVLAAIGGLVYYFIQRKKKAKEEAATGASTPTPAPAPAPAPAAPETPTVPTEEPTVPMGDSAKDDAPKAE